VDEIWQISQSKWSKPSLWTGRIDSNAWLMEMVTTFPKMSQVNSWTELNNGNHVKIEHSWTPYSLIQFLPSSLFCGLLSWSKPTYHPEGWLFLWNGALISSKRY
jgi:hypothetical protein